MTDLSFEFNFKINLFMTQEELNKVLEAHKHYLAQDCEGWMYMSANLYGANLSSANLRSANLRSANLSGANLYGADISDADLMRADLYGANLMRADLSGADLSDAVLYGADLRSADLRIADLSGADLSAADLRSADLRSADLRSADLSGANLSGVKMRVPSEAKRSSATSRKCRCEYAEVLELQNLDGTPYEDDKIVNNKYIETIYKVGEIVHSDLWDDNRWNECSHGIHFFLTRDEALRYA